MGAAGGNVQSLVDHMIAGAYWSLLVYVLLVRFLASKNDNYIA